ncbi:MAG: hypothetical protein RBR38_07625 [Desulfomicrobium apsheronum]|nr:hypothetical protein [Desulfomicrobium apsheronum]
MSDESGGGVQEEIEIQGQTLVLGLLSPDHSGKNGVYRLTDSKNSRFKV